VGERNLRDRYPPSPPCSCDICVSYCQRPGWWTVEQAAAAIEAGHARRMMLEMAPDRSFGVLAPAFRGNEVEFALEQHASRGCTFLEANRCELYDTGHQPLECRYCHHDRPGMGSSCHDDIGRTWDSPEGRSLVVRWAKLTGFWESRVSSALSPSPKGRSGS
jgi:hypothetical protein